MLDGSRRARRGRRPRRTGATGLDRFSLDLHRLVLRDRQRVDDALELLADSRREGGRGRRDAADLAATVEVVRAVERHVLRRLAAEKEQRQPELSGVLLLRPATDSLNT